MSEISTILLGILQGLTEFLPVSSSGHLTLGQHLFGISGKSNLSFDVAVHVGTVLSVITIYYRSVMKITRDFFWSIFHRKMTVGFRFAGLVFVASIPTAILGLGFHDFFAGLFHNLYVVALAFLCTTILLWLTQGRSKDEMGSNFLEFEGPLDINLKQAIVIGFAQGIALVPGISRSGSTIGAGLIVGVPSRTAALFSFMMAIPAILGAALLQITKLGELTSYEIQQLILGLVVSYIAGLVGLKLVLRFVRKGRIHIFSYYLIVVSLWTFFLASGQ